MSNLSEIIKDKFQDIHITNGDRELFWDVMNKEFVVLERRPHSKKPTLLIRTAEEEEAVGKLVYMAEECI